MNLNPNPPMNNPLDSRQRIHLEWMMENQPQLVRQLNQSNQLRPHLEAKMQQALRLTDNLKQQRGLDEESAFQVAAESVLNPADGPAMSDDPPEPMPAREQAAVYRKLEQ